MYNYFRKDVIALGICLYIALIGSLVLIISKYISRKIIHRIPQSNISPQPSISQTESFQMTTFHSTSRIIQVQPINKNDPGGDLFLLFTNIQLPWSLLCEKFLIPDGKRHYKNKLLSARDTTETIESGSLCITDLFQNKGGALYLIFLSQSQS